MNFWETSKFLEKALQTLWCNFELLSILKKLKNCGKTLEHKSQYSEVIGKIMEFRKILQQFVENVGESLQKCKSKENLATTWKKTEKKFGNLQKNQGGISKKL